MSTTAKNAILKAKIEGVISELMVKTDANNVYVDSSTTLAAKLTAIIANNDIKSVTVVRMEVPCCGGIEFAVKNALQASGKFIPWRVVVVSTDGNIIE